MPRSVMAHPPLVALVLLLSATLALAKVKRGENWMYGRMFPASRTPLLKSALEADKEGRAALKTLLTYYEDIDEKLRDSVSKDDFDKLEDTNVVSFLRFYGWPKMNETQLVLPIKPRSQKDVTRYRKEKKEFAAFDKRVFEALSALGNALDSPTAAERVKKFTASRNVTQWDHVFHNSRTNYTTEKETHKCIIRSNLGVRINGSWANHVSVTNDRPKANRRERERITLREVYRFSKSGDIEFVPFMMDINFKPELKYWGDRPYNNGSTEDFLPTPVASLFAEFGGTTGVHFFITRPLKDNIALREATEAGGELARQVVESKVWTNTAILALPLFMSLVPLALYSDASNIMYFIYMVFTDFLAVLPLAIKGGELIMAGQRGFFSTRTVIRGVPEFIPGTLVATTWSCRCEAAEGNNTAYGWAFVTTSVAACVVGITLEFVLKARVEKNKLEARKKFSMLTSQAVYFWERSGPCAECDCYARCGIEQLSASQLSVGGLIGQILERRKEGRQASSLEKFRGE